MPVPKILSIIIPVYNESKTAPDLLQMLDNLSLRGVKKELIIIESNSRDNSREIVQDFAKGRSDVKLILEDKPGGKGCAVRKGFTAAVSYTHLRAHET